VSNNPLRLPFMQGILTSRGSKSIAEPNRQAETNRQVAEVKRYISLRIYQVEQPQANACHPSPVQYLEAGQQYRIVLQCNVDRLDASQKEVTIAGAFNLDLRCEVKDGICPIAIQQQEMLHFKGPFADRVEIPFQLPQHDCPSCRVTFSIMFITDKNLDGPIPAHCTLEIKGNYTPENGQWLKARYIEAGVPKNTIVLSAEPTNPPPGNTSKECLLTAWNYHRNGMFCEPLDTSKFINVAKLISDKESPAKILHSLRWFSLSTAGGLMGWIRTVKTEVEKRGQQLGLVIFDTTAFEIPWELLEIDYNDQYLGAVAQVARWLPLEAFGNAYPLKIADYTCEGSVVSYLDNYLEGTIAERELLQKFEHSEITSLEELVMWSEESLQGVGLLYIGSHGSGGTSLYSASPAKGSILRALELLDMQLILDPRPTLFVNACESARIIYRKDSNAYNLVKNFLLLCASNYIGTIANVNSEEAPRIANRMLELAREDEGLLIVELLRRLRANAIKERRVLWQELKDQKEFKYRQRWEANAAQVLNTFLYVYYGNPLARLRLRPAQSEKEEA
jgi:hypothetical protein